VWENLVLCFRSRAVTLEGMRKHRILITGGAGFIGVNAARRFLEDGWDVSVWDNLSRWGAEKNLCWLQNFGPAQFTQIDLRHEARVNECFQQARFDLVLHCAGQVAVTASLTNPRHDLENNVLTTFNLLEAVRLFQPEAFFVFASTNKVYGGLENTRIVQDNGRYELADFPAGVPETQPLDFNSPYGCSKGAADQYVRDYSRAYGLATTCFRQSCVYGFRQFGLEDQGWVAWFLIANALRKPITIFGDGRQSRDLLFIDDLVDAYRMAWLNREQTAGQVYNIGGGPQNQLSLKQLVQWIEAEEERPIEVGFAPSRPGDQKVFVADVRKALKDFGWRPTCAAEEGIGRLNRWVQANLGLIRDVVAMALPAEQTDSAESPASELAWAPAVAPGPGGNKRVSSSSAESFSAV
jgi:CDP-paratose 2-epimerase